MKGIESSTRSLSHYKQKPKKVDFTGVAKSLQSDLDSVFKSEIAMRKRNIDDLDRQITKIKKYSILSEAQIDHIYGMFATDEAEQKGTKAFNRSAREQIFSAEKKEYRRRSDIGDQWWTQGFDG